MYSSGIVAFATWPVSGLSSSTLPVRTARSPSNTISVSGPAYSAKLELVWPSPLHAAIHSLWTPGDRGYFGAGGCATISACFAGSSSRGSSP